LFIFSKTLCKLNMATKKPVKKALTSNWFDIDRLIDNLRKEVEKASHTS